MVTREPQWLGEGTSLLLALGVAVFYWRLFWSAWRAVAPRRAALLDGGLTQAPDAGRRGTLAG